MAEHLESLAWHVTAGVTRETRNRDTKVGPALTVPGQPLFARRSGGVIRGHLTKKPSAS